MTLLVYLSAVGHVRVKSEHSLGVKHVTNIIENSFPFSVTFVNYGTMSGVLRSLVGRPVENEYYSHAEPS